MKKSKANMQPQRQANVRAEGARRAVKVASATAKATQHTGPCWDWESAAGLFSGSGNVRGLSDSVKKEK